MRWSFPHNCLLANPRLSLVEKVMRESAELALISEFMSGETGMIEWGRWSKMLISAAASAGARHGAAEAHAQIAAAQAGQAQQAPANAGQDAMAQG